MKYLPFEDFYIDTPLSPEQIQQRMEKELNYENGFGLTSRYSLPADSFTGYIFNNNFQIRRVIRYRNSFLPIIKGTIWPDVNGGSRLHITMKMDMVIIVFMCVWLTGTFTAGIATVVQGLSGNTQFDPLVLVPFGMSVFGYAIVMLGFKPEAKKAREKLLDMLNGSIFSEPSVSAQVIK